MTILSVDNRRSYSGDGSTTVFSFPVRFLEDADVKVALRVNDVESEPVLNTDYSVTGAGNPAGGSVTFSVAPVAGATMVIYNDPALTQSVDYRDDDEFPAETHERALDKLTLIVQRLSDRFERTLQFEETEDNPLSAQDVLTRISDAETARDQAQAAATETAADLAETSQDVIDAGTARAGAEAAAGSAATDAANAVNAQLAQHVLDAQQAASDAQAAASSVDGPGLQAQIDEKLNAANPTATGGIVWGNSRPLPDNTDLDGVVTGGVYYVRTTVGVPSVTPALPDDWYYLVVHSLDGLHVLHELMELNGGSGVAPRKWVRVRDTGWGPWQEVLHTGNIEEHAGGFPYQSGDRNVVYRRTKAPDGWSYVGAQSTNQDTYSFPGAAQAGENRGIFNSDNNLFITGGDGTVGSDALFFELSTGAWTTAPNRPTTQQSNAPGLVAIPGTNEILVIGGRRSSTIYDDCHRYRPDTNDWLAVGNYPFSAWQVGKPCAHTNGKIYAFGGLNTSSAASTQSGIYVFDPATDLWTTEPAALPASVGNAQTHELPSGEILICPQFVDGGANSTGRAFIYNVTTQQARETLGQHALTATLGQHALTATLGLWEVHLSETSSVVIVLSNDSVQNAVFDPQTETFSTFANPLGRGISDHDAWVADPPVYANIFTSLARLYYPNTFVEKD